MTSKSINKKTDHNLISLSKTVSSVNPSDAAANAALLLEIDFYQRLLADMSKQLKNNIKAACTIDGTIQPSNIVCDAGIVSVTIKNPGWIISREKVQDYCDENNIPVSKFEKQKSAAVEITIKRK